MSRSCSRLQNTLQHLHSLQHQYPIPVQWFQLHQQPYLRHLKGCKQSKSSCTQGGLNMHISESTCARLAFTEMIHAATARYVLSCRKYQVMVRHAIVYISELGLYVDSLEAWSFLQGFSHKGLHDVVACCLDSMIHCTLKWSPADSVCLSGCSSCASKPQECMFVISLDWRSV